MKKAFAILSAGLLLVSSLSAYYIIQHPLGGPSSGGNHRNTAPLPPPLTSGNTFMISSTLLQEYAEEHPFPPKTNYSEALGFDSRQYEYIENLTGAFNLTPDQLKLLDQNGFIVIDGQNASFINFNQAYKQYWETDLPVFITADCILNVYHLLLEDVLKTYETCIMGPAMETMTQRLYNDSILNLAGPRENANDFKQVSIYFAVAISLLSPGVAIDPSIRDEVGAFLDKITKATDVEQFPGQDYTQYRPRGHYTETPYLQKYFKAMMWLQRMLLNMSSPDDVVQAWAITHLLDSDAPAMACWNTIYNITRLLIGTPDSMDQTDLAGVLDKLFGGTGTMNITNTSIQRVIQEIDSGQYYRSKICSFVIMDTDYNQVSFPKTWSLMGQRYVLDADIMDNLIYDRIPLKDSLRRGLASPLDVMAALGSPRAFEILGPEMQKYGYEQQLKQERAKVQLFNGSFWDQTVYNKVLQSYQPLISGVPAAAPQKFMQTKEWADEKLNTVLGSYAELKYDTILYAKQTYSSTSCSYPDAYVEPYTELYQGIGQVCDMILNLTKCYPIYTLQESGYVANGPYYNYTFNDFKGTCLKLAEISAAEKKGHALTTEQVDFLRAVYSGDKICASGEGPHFVGWLPRLLWHLTKDEKDLETSVVADICTDPWEHQVKEIATGHVDTLLVLIDKPDGTRFAAAGPVYSYYEFDKPVTDRMTTDEWRSMLASNPPSRPEWAGDFLA